MILKVRALDFNYTENNEISDVTARFEVTDTNGDYISGNMKITKEEYEDSENLSEIALIVKDKLKVKINTL